MPYVHLFEWQEWQAIPPASISKSSKLLAKRICRRDIWPRYSSGYRERVFCSRAKGRAGDSRFVWRRTKSTCSGLSTPSMVETPASNAVLWGTPHARMSTHARCTRAGRVFVNAFGVMSNRPSLNWQGPNHQIRPYSERTNRCCRQTDSAAIPYGSGSD